MDGAANGQSSRITPADFQGRTGRLFLLGSLGTTQTIHAWRDQPSTPTPELWHHDLLHRDGSHFDQGEVDTFRKLTASR